MTLNRTIVPEIHPVEKIDFRMPDSQLLSSGARLHLLEEGDQEVIRIEWVFWKGSWNQSKKLQAYACMKMLSEGAAGKSSREIAEKLQYHGAYLDERSNHHSSSLVLYALTKHLPKLLPLVKDLLTLPDFPEKEFGVMVTRALQEFRIESEKVNSLARRHFNSLIYGENHPYGVLVEEDDFSAIQPEDARWFHSQHFNPNLCDIIACGRTYVGFLSDMEELFGDSWLTPSNTHEEEIPSDFVYSPKTSYMAKPGALQAALRIGKPLIHRLHPDYHGFSVLNTLLGGYFGSRLMSNLREDKGYTYGIGSGLASLKKGAYFFISSQVAANHWEDAVSEVRHEMKKLCEESVGAQELEIVKNYLWGSLSRSFDGPFAKAERVRTYLEYGMDEEDLRKMMDTLTQIDSTELNQLAIKYLNPDTMTQLVVGP